MAATWVTAFGNMHCREALWFFSPLFHPPLPHANNFLQLYIWSWFILRVQLSADVKSWQYKHVPGWEVGNISVMSRAFTPVPFPLPSVKIGGKRLLNPVLLLGDLQGIGWVVKVINWNSVLLGHHHSGEQLFPSKLTRNEVWPWNFLPNIC